MLLLVTCAQTHKGKPNVQKNPAGVVLRFKKNVEVIATMIIAIAEVLAGIVPIVVMPRTVVGTEVAILARIVPRSILSQCEQLQS